MFPGLFLCAVLFAVFSLNAATRGARTRYALLAISVLFSVLAVAADKPRTTALFLLGIVSLTGLNALAVALNAAREAKERY